MKNSEWNLSLALWEHIREQPESNRWHFLFARGLLLD